CRATAARLAVGDAQPAALWGSRAAGLSGVVQLLQFEDRVARRQVGKGLHRRALWHREKALHLSGEAVEIGFENRRAEGRRKLAHGIACRRHARASTTSPALRALRTQLAFPRAQTR